MAKKVKAGRWVHDEPWEARRVHDGGMLELAWVDRTGWRAWFDAEIDTDEPDATGPETGEAGRDAADAALRAAGVVLL